MSWTTGLISSLFNAASSHNVPFFITAATMLASWFYQSLLLHPISYSTTVKVKNCGICVMALV